MTNCPSLRLYTTDYQFTSGTRYIHPFLIGFKNLGRYTILYNGTKWIQLTFINFSTKYKILMLHIITIANGIRNPINVFIIEWVTNTRPAYTPNTSKSGKHLFLTALKSVASVLFDADNPFDKADIGTVLLAIQIGSEHINAIIQRNVDIFFAADKLQIAFLHLLEAKSIR